MKREIVLNASQLKCLVSPSCNEVMACLRTLGEASAAEIASHLGHSPATAHYHLKALERVGLATVVERRPTSRKPIAVYGLVAVRFKLPTPESEPGLQALSAKAILAGVRQAMRGYSSASQEGRTTHVLKGQMRLTPSDAREFIALIEQASRFAEEHDLAEGGVLLNWSSLTYEDSR